MDGSISDENFAVQPVLANDTRCEYVSHGDPLKHLCDPSQGISCCLYRAGIFCWMQLCLMVDGGNNTFLLDLFSHLPVEKITTCTLILVDTDLSNKHDDSLCTLSNLKTLDAGKSRLERFNCLSQLRNLGLQSDVIVTKTAFQGLDHLSSLKIYTNDMKLSLSTDGMMELQANKELKNIEIVSKDLAVLDVWPLCLAQIHPGIHINLFHSAVVDLTNTLNSSRCNITTPLLTNASINLGANSITHVSDIVTGWRFSSMHQFIRSFMWGHSTEFPIDLGGNPFTCGCRDRDLYRILRDPQYNLHLTNLLNLTCGRPLKLRGRRFETLLDSELNCDPPPPLSLILGVSVGGTVILAVAVVGFLFYNRIRLYRWSGHKLHPWDRDECIEENKEFDVFVSHASEDEEWTLELIEDLENRGFKALFHKRDFELGVTKIENIMMAIDKSKRTICVLSPSFAASPWCTWEFITVFF